MTWAAAIAALATVAGQVLTLFVQGRLTPQHLDDLVGLLHPVAYPGEQPKTPTPEDLAQAVAILAQVAKGTK